jgi:16S rRNA processing protein RimM
MAGPVVLGRIVGAHGLKGQVRVQYFGDGPDNLFQIEEIRLAERRDSTDVRRFEITFAGTGRGGEIRLGLEGISDRDAAVALRGQLILADASELQNLEEGEYYWHELVGCRVETTEGRVLGTVREIWESGAHDVLVVEEEGGRQHLVPTARELMTEVNLDERRILVEAIPGLFDFE